MTTPAAHGPTLTPEEVEERLAQADGALGAAGHHVDDPDARQIVRDQIAGRITTDEAERLLVLDAISKASSPSA